VRVAGGFLVEVRPIFGLKENSVSKLLGIT